MGWTSDLMGLLLSLDERRSLKECRRFYEQLVLTVVMD